MLAFNLCYFCRHNAINYIHLTLFKKLDKCCITHFWKKLLKTYFLTIHCDLLTL